MVDIQLPATLRTALDEMLAAAGGTRSEATALSDAYRARQSSATAVATEPAIAAYLATRMPATFAAVATVLAEAQARVPGFAPRSLLDAGAGPGTASWAAIEAFPSLERIRMIDRNAALMTAAGELAAASDQPALAGAERRLESVVQPAVDGSSFDLVVASYALTELADADIARAASSLWKRCTGLLVIVEPGRPRDYERLMAVRAALFDAGARIVAPCPHELPCPLSDGDWCHFSVRLPRSRAHRQLKGGTLGYEDEKFSYLVVARPELGPVPAARVIKPPVVRKFEVELPLCGADGLEQRIVPKRDGPAFKAAKKLAWGDAVD